MSLRWLIPTILVTASCDPVNNIGVHVPVNAGLSPAQPALVSVFWVKTYEGRSYAQGPVIKREVIGTELVETRDECCGTAHAYRAGQLWFLACVANAGSDPVLVCGQPDPSRAPIVRSTAHGTTCDAIENAIGRTDVHLETCTLSPSRLP
jgi:hypothetical protein